MRTCDRSSSPMVWAELLVYTQTLSSPRLPSWRLWGVKRKASDVSIVACFVPRQDFTFELFLVGILDPDFADVKTRRASIHLTRFNAS
jgi:hypothetical protein